MDRVQGAPAEAEPANPKKGIPAPKSDKIIKHGLWYDFLYTSFLDGKSYDRMVREILLADDSKEELKSASKFFHDRDCEPNTLTRDIGRLFFGMDMQCNQCHDHPSDVWKRNNFHELAAYFARSTSFERYVGGRFQTPSG